MKIKKKYEDSKEDCQALEIKINTSLVLYGLKIIVFKPEIISNQIYQLFQIFWKKIVFFII